MLFKMTGETESVKLQTRLRSRRIRALVTASLNRFFRRPSYDLAYRRLLVFQLLLAVIGILYLAMLYVAYCSIFIKSASFYWLCCAEPNFAIGFVGNREV